MDDPRRYNDYRPRFGAGTKLTSADYMLITAMAFCIAMIVTLVVMTTTNRSEADYYLQRYERMIK